MKKQKWLLFNLGAYLVGIATCLLIKNFSVLFVLMVIPTFFVFLRGAMNENKWNKLLKEIQENKNSITAGFYQEVNPSERLPERSWRDPQYRTSQHNTSNTVFVMTDNGLSIAYYDYEDGEWKDHNRDNYERVIYWLEKVK